MQTSCEWIVVAMFIGGFLRSVYISFNGREATPPSGFGGFLAACADLAFAALVLWGAGAFQVIFG
jgi:hypothetical protein